MSTSTPNPQTPLMAVQKCDDCGKPMPALGVVLYNVHGPFPGPQRLGEAKLEAKYYSTDIAVKDIAGYIQTRRVWCDANSQRGQKEGKHPSQAEYNLADDVPKGYVVDLKRVEEIVKAMEAGSLFGGTLTWNLRPGDACWHYDPQTEVLVISASSKVYLPDSHHRHLAIKRALQLIWENRLNAEVGNKMFTVNIYQMDKTGEGQLFFEYNQLGVKADTTRAYVLSQTDPFSKIVRELIDLPPFANNVETVSNRLSKSSPKMVTFGTVHDAIRDARKGAPGRAEDEVPFYSKFFEMLARVRPQIGLLSAAERNRVRESSVVDQAVLFHAYIRLAEHVRADLDAAKTPKDTERVWESWAKKLETLRAGEEDFFARNNPAWQHSGVIRRSRSGGLLVANTRDTRQQAYELLRKEIGVGDLKATGAGKVKA